MSDSNLPPSSNNLTWNELALLIFTMSEKELRERAVIKVHEPSGFRCYVFIRSIDRRPRKVPFAPGPETSGLHIVPARPLELCD